MRITRTLAAAGLGAAVATLGAFVFVAGASSSAAAPVHAPLVTHPAAAAPAAAPGAAPAAAPVAAPADPTDVTVTSRQQVAWTQRAAADTTAPVNRCAPVLGSDGAPLHDPAGGLVYPALIDDPRAEADIAGMDSAMAAGDQQAYDTAYHDLDLAVTCH